MISPPQSELYIISGNRSAKHLDVIGWGRLVMNFKVWIQNECVWTGVYDGGI